MGAADDPLRPLPADGRDVWAQKLRARTTARFAGRMVEIDCQFPLDCFEWRAVRCAQGCSGPASGSLAKCRL
eukprot:2726823-Pleurochrysis_carterae.AAC.1